MSREFVGDIKAIRLRARTHYRARGRDQGYKGNLEVVLRLLNEALATEIVCVVATWFAKRSRISSRARSAFVSPGAPGGVAAMLAGVGIAVTFAMALIPLRPGSPALPSSS